MKSESFLNLLHQLPSKRVPLTTVIAAFLKVFTEYGDHHNHREPLAKLLGTLAVEGRLILPKSKALWDTVAKPPLPEWVETLSRETKREKKAAIAWLPELAPTAAKLKQQTQLRDLSAINAYLIANRGRLRPVPYRERSLKIFGDEHYLDSKIRKGGLFLGRLPLSVLYAFEAAEPMPYERPPSLLTGKPLLIVENHHSFASFVHANAIRETFSAVCFASGNTLASREYSLETIGETLKTSHYLYLGDIDSRGLSIPLEINASRSQRGVPLLKPATVFYAWLLRHGQAVLAKKQHPPVLMENVAEWFSQDEVILRKISAILSKNMRIPQEYLGLEELLQLNMSGSCPSIEATNCIT